MDSKIFVQNVREICKKKGIKPTVACETSGAGKNLLNHIETRGSIPSVEKVQLLAQFLGVTTSQLLGEKEPDTTLDAGSPSENEMIFRSFPPELQDEALRYMRYLVEQQKQKGGPAVTEKGCSEPAGE